MQRPLLLEGEAGVGKTEVAKVLARWTGGELVRLQCYEGIDAAQAVYEWDYSRQLLHLRAVEAGGGEVVEDELYSEQFLVRRPLLRAIAYEHDALGATAPPVLLVDEVDRADDEFEAFLLEILSDYTVTVPELGTFRAAVPPIVVVTSNRTRDVHDALKRRCLYHWIDHPDFERELAILRVRAPEVPDTLARQVAAAVEVLRGLELYKPPGVAETIDWANALAALGHSQIDERVVGVTLGTILKYREDQERTRAHGIDQLVQRGHGAWCLSPTKLPSTERSCPSSTASRSGFARGPARRPGSTVPVGSTITFVEALAAVGVGRRRVGLLGRPGHAAAPAGGRRDLRPVRSRRGGSTSTRCRSAAPPIVREVMLAFDTGGDDEPDAGDDAERERSRQLLSVRYSRAEVLRHRDFAHYSPDEFAEARRLMADLRLTGATAALAPHAAEPPQPRPSRPPAHRPAGHPVGR